MDTIQLTGWFLVSKTLHRVVLYFHITPVTHEKKWPTVGAPCHSIYIYIYNDWLETPTLFHIPFWNWCRVPTVQLRQILQDTTYILRYIKCFYGKSLLAAQKIRFLSRDYAPASDFGWWLEKKGNVIAFVSKRILGMINITNKWWMHQNNISQPSLKGRKRKKEKTSGTLKNTASNHLDVPRS